MHWAHSSSIPQSVNPQYNNGSAEYDMFFAENKVQGTFDNYLRFAVNFGSKFDWPDSPAKGPIGGTP